MPRDCPERVKDRMSEYHVSVLLQEILENLDIKPGKKYIDATLGGGGHTIAIANAGGEVLSLDVDEDALHYVKEKLKVQSSKLKITLARGNFKDIDVLAKENGFEKVSGIIFDLGVSSHQFEEGERGFSFRFDTSLDMRMDKSLSVTAADLVNGLTKGELYELFTKFGEEHFARAISDGIVRTREIKRIETTGELAKIAERAYPRGFHKVHPATKIFQALRIVVNDELNNLKEALPRAIDLLETSGRLCIITFHSLEDRIVKEAYKEFEIKGLGKIITKKPIIPTEEEIEKNNKSRSAKLRIFEKI